MPTSCWRCRTTIVLDHFASIPAAGGVDQPAVKAVLKMLDTGRVWLKLSGPMRCTPEHAALSVGDAARACSSSSTRRSGWCGARTGRTSISTACEMPNDGDLLDLMADWVPDAAVRNRILTQNAKNAVRVLATQVAPQASAQPGMRDHLAHDVRQRLAVQFRERDPAHAGRRFGLRRHASRHRPSAATENA